jgi:hypothetical protein
MEFEMREGRGRVFMKNNTKGTLSEIGYDTPEQAEKSGLIISKKWIDAGKP